ncbi:MAG: dethiobiotin synthase [Rudaea sp.]
MMPHDRDGKHRHPAGDRKATRPQARHGHADAGVFVTGTDTGVGKTIVAVGLLRALVRAGFRACGMKPVAAGCDASGVNADVIALEAAGNVDAPLAERNPYAFAEPVAPHLAAEATGRPIELAAIARAYACLRARADVLVVEGAGGALVPLDARHDMLDVAAALSLPVLLVVGMRLGCLNHALLTALAVQRRGLELCGWIANELPPGMPLLAQNVDTLARRLGLPPVAVLPPGAGTLGADALVKLRFLRSPH